MNKYLSARNISCAIFIVGTIIINTPLHAQVNLKFIRSTALDTTRVNTFYPGNRAPLLRQPFSKLPITAFQPGGWLRKQLDLQRNGLTGHLGEISIWLSRQDNAWVNKDGKGKYGWEELPYWLKGYGDIGYVLRDDSMIKEARYWIDFVLKNQRANGDFGPLVTKKGNRDLWTNMPMLWCLQSYYDFTGDKKVLELMGRYFKWELTIPDIQFLEDYWENSRGGDNLNSVYWLYNHTGESWLLDLAAKIDGNTANWRQPSQLPNWHNVNIAQCFREPATFYLQSHDLRDRESSYNDFRLVKEKYGQVPGGMWGGDENSRPGYDDPRQAVETCGMVEQMTSDQFLLAITGDPGWADNCEDIAFNSFPAAFMADYRALRYLTAPNMVVSDAKNHSPGIDNAGPFLMMNPFSSRCCQHNHAAGWVYYAENSWLAAPGNGLAAVLYSEGKVTATVGHGTKATISTTTHYPFEESIEFSMKLSGPDEFPLYLRIPAWCQQPSITVNGKAMTIPPINGIGYIRLNGKWKSGDRISLGLPMQISVREWTANKNSVSINYGPLCFSLDIAERYIQQSSRDNAQHDARWQETADANRWPAFEIFPASNWNYGLLLDNNTSNLTMPINRKKWPEDNNPFVKANTPLSLTMQGKKIPGWEIDQYGLCATLPQSPVSTGEATEELTLLPMGACRLRIAAFPVVR